MGFPLVGETLQFFSPSTSSDVHPFVKDRMERYGPIFKTNLLGQPVIVSADSDLNHFVFLQEGQLFQSWYPDTFTEVLGRQNLSSLHDFMYKYLKNMVLSLFGPEGLKKMIPDVERMACQTLQRWSIQETVELRDATSSLIFDLTAKKLISCEPGNASQNLRDNFVAFIQGLISFPLNIPGTAYHKCLQGRKNTMKMLKKLLNERRAAMPGKNRVDFFDFVLEELDKEGTILTEAIALDLMFALLFASYETTSLALTMAVKFLSDHPLVLRKLKVRLANIAPLIFRKALREIEVKGYTIPAGWAVMVIPPAVHLNPAKYRDPLTFNPSRWEQGEINGASKNFMAFGGGMRFCIGADFAKLQMAVFLHCLVTKYRWEPIKGGNTVRTPGLQFPDGFHIRLKEKTRME
ncbi:hypothetical protein V6N12_054719 [Hibiscus sabdariffa]|uniref:Cytochrome P450 n=1 Tax=Hibiscus sabdariffa TaxID=183260 RepID=A0ABR2D194_9ROSI